MRKIIHYLLPLLLIACGGNTASNQESGNESIKSSCLADLIANNEIEKMISIESLAQIIGKPASNIEMQDNKSSSSKYSTMVYQWEAEEPRMMRMEVKAGDRVMVMENEVPNTVNVGNLELLEDEDPMTYFKRLYAPKSAAEKTQAKKDIDKASQNSDKVNQEQAETLKKMVDKQKSKAVDGVGDQAYFSTAEVSGVESLILRVLHGNVMFEVTADVSANLEEDLAMARKIAQEIIVQCK